MKITLRRSLIALGVLVLLLISMSIQAQLFTVNAGADFRINRKDGFAMLKGVISQAAATGREWRCLNRPANRAEIANILNPTRDTTLVIVLPPDFSGFYDFELKATHSGVTLRDTVRVFVDWGTYPPRATGPVIRMATAADIASIPNCVAGDAVIAGANDGPGFLGANKIDIYFDNPPGIALTAGHHLWIPAGNYNAIYLNFDTLQLKGDPGNPVIITNYGGQVECTQLVLRNATHTKITGKYVPGVSGDINFKGHDAGYAYSSGKYGIYCNAAWTNISGAGLRVKGKRVKGLEIEYLEIANGNFACTMIKEDNNLNDYDSLYVHDNYMHDSHGEANYWGSTAGDPQHQFNHARFVNNRVLRAGNELMQFNNQGDNNYVENNVFLFGALNWRSPFEAYNQANAIQLAVRNGKNYFRNNLVRGCGDQLISMFSQNNDAKYVSNGDTCHVVNNLLDYSRGFIASYIGGNNPCTNVKTNFSNNVLGRNIFMGDSIYTTAVSAGINTNNVLRTANGSSINHRIILRNNIRDNTKTVYAIGGNPLDSAGNTSATIAIPAFQNSGFADNLNYNRFDMWADSLFNTWKNEYGAPTPGQRYNRPVYYQVGDYVTFLSKIYRCRKLHTSEPPIGVTNEFWELQTWTNGGIAHTIPPDDYRLVSNDFYRLRKMGLLDSAAIAVNQPPTANAGPDTVLTLPNNSTPLNGSGTDPDGSIVAYQWTKLSGPVAGSLGNSNAAQANASGLAQGIYQFQLQVTDNSGAIDRDTVQVTVNAAPNQPPTANAGADIIITLPTNSTPLNGSGTDPDGSIVAYQWTKLSGPVAGSLINSNAAQANASGLTQGIYQFQLRVTDNSGAIDRDTVQVTVNAAANQPPTASAGADIIITLPTNSTPLNGSGTDPDGSIVAYQWTKLSGPVAGSLSNSNTAQANASGLTQGVYQFQLQVTDNSGAIDRDTVQVTVNAAPNQPPTANAGVDIIITLPTNSTPLNGSGTDPDGNIITYQWTKLSGPVAGSLSNSNAAQANASGLTQGVYQFQLQVTDNSGAIDRDTVQVTVNAAPNQPPTANAGADIILTLPTNSTPLNGSGTDPDGSSITYQWTKLSGPVAGSLSNSNAAQAIASGLTQGIYQFQLQVTDNSGAIDRDTVQVSVNAAPNQPPTASAGVDIIITLPTNSTPLNGSGTDPDGSIVAYQWTKISGPVAGSLSNSNDPQANASGLTQGVYQFQLQVTDNIGAIDRDTVQVTVNAAPNQPPTANAGSDIIITLPTNSTPLNGSGTDPDGSISTYQWTKISGPVAGSLINSNDPQANASGLVQGVYQFQLQVTDNSGAIDRDTVQVTVNAAPNQPPTANAGADIIITLPTNSTPLNGSGTDPDGSISTYQWTKISGPVAGSLSNSNAAQATASGLTQGVYQFQLQVTDNSGAIDRDTVQVTVRPPGNGNGNNPPRANAGADITLFLPGNATTLRGIGTDTDGTIVGYQWRVITAAGTYQLSSPTIAQPLIRDLQQGIYIVELTVSDNDSAIGKDSVMITVAAPRISVQNSVLKIFPNPVVKTLTAMLQIADITTKTSVILTDMRGAKVYQDEFMATQADVNYTVNMSRMMKGMYILTVRFANGEQINKKVIKL